MKKLTNIFIAAGIVLFAVACEKETNDTTPTVSTANKSFVQVFNATVNATRNYVYVNGAPANGAVFAYGAAFPATAYSFTVPSGAVNFLIRDTLSTSTQAQLSWIESLEKDKSYTIFMYDSTTTAKRKTVLNNIEIPADTTARLRFANMLHSTAPMPNVDVFSYRRNTNIFTNISATSVTDYITAESRTTDTLYFREAGTANQLLKLTFSGLTPKRSYTLVYRGSFRNPASRLATTFANN